jgi:hypothetical protein
MTQSVDDESVSITFVIGAGASKEVNLPTGYELKDVIANSLAFKTADFGTHILGGDASIREALFKLAQRQSPSYGDINDYLQTVRLIQSAMPQAPSIDNFIDSHRSDLRVAECGKLAIAAAILKAERSSLLYIDPSNIYNRLNFSTTSNTWLNSFFQLVTLNAQKEDLPSRFRKVRVISFNYDRCFEHYIHCSLKNYYGLSDNQATELVNELAIFHPYGSLGSLPWQSQNLAIPYGAETTSENLMRVAKNLRTFTEGTDSSSSQIDEIRASIHNASSIVFLGFAYNELNLEVLFGRPEGFPKNYEKKMFGSAYGISESNKKAIISELAVLGRADPDQITLRRELTAANVLPEYSRSLRV